MVVVINNLFFPDWKEATEDEMYLSPYLVIVPMSFRDCYIAGYLKARRPNVYILDSLGAIPGSFTEPKELIECVNSDMRRHLEQLRIPTTTDSSLLVSVSERPSLHKESSSPTTTEDTVEKSCTKPRPRI
jgi:hypothetical protein